MLILCIALLLIACAAVADTPDYGYEREFDGYLLKYGKLEVPVFQCSLYCAVLQLKRADIAVDIDLLKDMLDCDEEGTNMLSLKNALIAHGFAVQGVKELTVDGLERHLKNGGAAVLYSKRAHTIDHFLSVMGYADSTFITVDFPRRLRRIDRPTIKERLAKSGGVALLIEEGKGNAVKRGELSVEPNPLDFGDLKDKREDIVKDIRLINNSAYIAAISSIRTPCGCMELEFENNRKWLQPRESVRIKCKLHPTKWGNVEQKKIYLVFADGGILEVPVNAKPAVPDEVRISVSNTSIYIDDDAFSDRKKVIRHVRLEEDYGRSLEVESISSDAEWINVETRKGEGEKAKSTVEVMIEITQLDRSGDKSAKISLICKGRLEPIIINVRQHRARPFEISPPLLEINAGDEATLTFMPRSEIGPYSIEAVEGKCKCLSATWDKDTITGSASIKIQAASEDSEARECQDGFHRLVVRIKQGNQMVDVPIIVNLSRKEK